MVWQASWAGGRATRNKVLGQEGTGGAAKGEVTLHVCDWRVAGDGLRDRELVFSAPRRDAVAADATERRNIGEVAAAVLVVSKVASIGLGVADLVILVSQRDENSDVAK